MTPYAQLPTNNPEEYIRTVGLSKEDFQHLHDKLGACIDAQKALNPLTRRGRKDSKLAWEDRLLLVLYYLRHYPALINPGAAFVISESYCQKVYSRTARLLAKVEKPPTARRCWKSWPPPCPLMFRSSPIWAEIINFPILRLKSTAAQEILAQTRSDKIGNIWSKLSGAQIPFETLRNP